MTRESTTGIAYDASIDALSNPGAVDNFFRLHRPASRLGLAAELCRLAYCDFAQHLVPALRRVDYRLQASFEAQGTEAFLCQAPRAQGAGRILVFRGSDDIRAWIVNINARLAPWRGPGRVHQGFAQALEAVWPQITEALGADQGPLLITGHSQGAALASLAAKLLPGSALITLGSPRVGDGDFVAGLEGSTRLVNNRDIVCRLPFPRVPLMNDYRHFGQVIFVNAEGDLAEAPAGLTDSLDVNGETLREALLHLKQGAIPRHFADHAPINYVSALP